MPKDIFIKIGINDTNEKNNSTVITPIRRELMKSKV